MPILELIGSSARFRTVLDQIKMVAPVDSAVLIQGETGTGKEVIAHAIHDAGSRSQRRFVAVNCAAIPAALLESELFGHERGAFTGAATQTMGRFQAADGGTLFLDEVGDLPLELQPKLLRVLQEKQVERLGSDRAVRVDVRVIAATNQDLWKMVQERTFRADLFFRLNVFPITLPPLRDRTDDIPRLVEHFAQKFAKQQGKTIDRIPDDVLDQLISHDWPGNVRELQNVIECAVISSTGRSLKLHSTKLRRQNAESASTRTLDDATRAHILAALRETNWVLGGQYGAATQLGVPRTTLIAMMHRHGIVRENLGRPVEPPDRSHILVPNEYFLTA
jgi:formate hydrogenlyase transcriptional activator